MTKESMIEKVILRKIQKQDAQLISEAFREQGWEKPTTIYQTYFQLQEKGERDIIIAEYDEAFVGYLTIAWRSHYKEFAKSGIPEIIDFNVLKKYQRRGIGTLLMDEAESRIKRVSRFAGIGFGLYSDYGAAQILYVKRGYIPEGRGIVKDSRSIRPGETVVIDDSVVLYLIKEL